MTKIYKDDHVNSGFSHVSKETWNTSVPKTSMMKQKVGQERKLNIESRYFLLVFIHCIK